MEQCHAKWLGNQKKKKSDGRNRTVDHLPRAAEITPLGLHQAGVKETTAVLFNRGKAGKLTPT